MKKQLLGFLAILVLSILFSTAVSAHADHPTLYEDEYLWDMETFYAGKTGAVYNNSIYYLYDGSIIKGKYYTYDWTFSQSDYLEGIKDMCMADNLLLYITDKNVLHLRDLKESTDIIVKKNADKIIGFDGTSIAYQPVNKKTVKYINKRGKAVKKPEFAKYYNEKLDENCFRLRNELFRLETDADGVATLYKEEKGTFSAVNSLDLSDFLEKGSYEIVVLDNYFALKISDGTKDYFRIFSRSFNQVDEREYKIDIDEYELYVKDDYLYIYDLNQKGYKRYKAEYHHKSEAEALKSYLTYYCYSFKYLLKYDVPKVEKISFGTSPEGGSLQWTVLDKQDGKMFIIYDGILKKDKRKSYIWEKTRIREWLNGEFYENYFSADEKKKILETTLKNYDFNPDKYRHLVFNNLFTDVSACRKERPDTTDRIFLLGPDEVVKYKSLLWLDGSKWWLRNGYVSSDYCGLYYTDEDSDAYGLTEDGEVYVDRFLNGVMLISDWLGVRPAMWITCDE